MSTVLLDVGYSNLFDVYNAVATTLNLP